VEVWKYQLPLPISGDSKVATEAKISLWVMVFGEAAFWRSMWIMAKPTDSFRKHKASWNV